MTGTSIESPAGEVWRPPDAEPDTEHEPDEVPVGAGD